jgi:hypothetical protein
MRRVHATTVAVEKQLSITYSKCVFVALGAQHATHMRHIFICGLLGSTIFFQLSHKRHYFRKEKLFNMKRVFQFSLQFYSKYFSL